MFLKSTFSVLGLLLFSSLTFSQGGNKTISPIEIEARKKAAEKVLRENPGKFKVDANGIVRDTTGEFFRLLSSSARSGDQPVIESISPGNYSQPGSAEGQLPTVVAPSPNSVGLINSISDNVDLYTGKLSVQIPLYTLKSSNIEVPIGISIKGNAHKVNDIGSWTGLGCNLNAGGAITRVMNSLPDEFTGTISSTFNIPGIGFIKLKTDPNPDNRIDLSSFPDVNNVVYSVEKKKDIVYKGAWNNKNNLPPVGYDLQPDDFYFNFGNYSGKFVFDQDGNVNVISKNNLKITPSFSVIGGNNKIVSFEVLTDDGVKYNFGNGSFNSVEETKSSSTSQSLLYHYIYSGYIPASGLFVYERMPAVLSLVEPPGTIILNNFPANTETINHCSYPSTWNLTKITSPKGDIVDFTYADNGTINYLADRNYNASIIDFVEDKLGTTTPYFISAIEPIQLHWWPYAYPTSHVFTETKTNIELKSKRLSEIISTEGKVVFEATVARNDFPGDKKLSNIIIKNLANETVKQFELTYEDEYNEDPFETFTFYYMGPYYYYSGGLYAGTAYQPANHTKLFSIDPYNRYRMFLKRIKEKGRSGEEIPPYVLEYHSDVKLPFRTSTEQDYFGFANYNPNRHPFTSVNYSYPSSGGTVTVPRYTYPILYFEVASSIGYPSSPTLAGNKTYSEARMKAGVIKKISYPTGGYKEFSYEFSGYVNVWNGLRPLEIKETESAGALSIVKQYGYGQFRNADVVVHKYTNYESQIGTWLDNRVFFGSSRSNPANLTKGSEGGYDYAEVSQPGNGRTRVEFTNLANYPDVANNTYRVSSLFTPEVLSFGAYFFPFPSTNNYDWKRGLPKMEYTYPEGSTNPLKTVEYNYDFTAWNSLAKKITGLHVSRAPFKYGANNFYMLLFAPSDNFSEWYNLVSKKQRDYEQGGSNYTEVEELYSYNTYTFNNKDILLPGESKLVRNSRNEQVIQKFKYPLDYSPTTDEFGLGISYLKTKNMLTAPIEQYTYLQTQSGTNQRYIGAVLNKYHSDKPLQKEVFKLKTDGLLNSFTPSNSSGGVFNKDVNYRSELQFPVYDAAGHILQQNKTNDISEAYKWGYNNMYPVAKAMNAAANEIDYSSFEPGDSYYSTNSESFPTSAITGNYIRRMPINQLVPFGNLAANKEYKFTFWNTGPSITVHRIVSGVPQVAGTLRTLKVINGWTCFEVTIPPLPNTSTLRLSNGGFPVTNDCYMDEARLYPSTSQMVTYSFTPLVGMSSETDINNRTTYYEYDGLSRLSIVKDENKHIIKTICYNYAGLPVPCAVNSIVPCVAPVITSAIHSATLQVTVSYTVPPATTSCRIELRNAFDVVVGSLNSPSCSSPAVINVSGTGYFYAYVIAYSSQCPGGTLSQPVGVKVMF